MYTDEPENANQDVRSKLKKKAERGLQRKDSKIDYFCFFFLFYNF